jgi:hypothetical protein
MQKPSNNRKLRKRNSNKKLRKPDGKQKNQPRDLNKAFSLAQGWPTALLAKKRPGETGGS